jgi:preprotein translocase subunit SecG
MISFLLVSQLVITILLIIVILVQKSASMGLGAYSGSNESVFGAKGPASFLVKLTFILSFIFVVNTLAMGYIYNKDKASSLVDDITIVDTKNSKTPPATAIPKSK